AVAAPPFGRVRGPRRRPDTRCRFRPRPFVAPAGPPPTAGARNATLWPPLFVLYPEGADRTVRKRHPFRIPDPVARPSRHLRGIRTTLADPEIPVASGRRASGDGGHQHHRISGYPSSGTIAADPGRRGRSRGCAHAGSLLRQLHFRSATEDRAQPVAA